MLPNAKHNAVAVFGHGDRFIQTGCTVYGPSFFDRYLTDLFWITSGLVLQGARRFLTTLSGGVDVWLAYYVLSLARLYPELGMELYCMIPLRDCHKITRIGYSVLWQEAAKKWIIPTSNYERNDDENASSACIRNSAATLIVSEFSECRKLIKLSANLGKPVIRHSPGNIVKAMKYARVRVFPAVADQLACGHEPLEKGFAHLAEALLSRKGTGALLWPLPDMQKMRRRLL